MCRNKYILLKVFNLHSSFHRILLALSATDKNKYKLLTILKKVIKWKNDKKIRCIWLLVYIVNSTKMEKRRRRKTEWISNLHTGNSTSDHKFYALLCFSFACVVMLIVRLALFHCIRSHILCAHTTQRQSIASAAKQQEFMLSQIKIVTQIQSTSSFVDTR